MLTPDADMSSPTSPHLPADRAFVVQFEREEPRRRRDVGRVEHLATGAWTHFEDWRELQDFIGATLGAGRDGSD